MKIEFESNHIRGVDVCKNKHKNVDESGTWSRKNDKGPGKVLEFCQADSVGTMFPVYMSQLKYSSFLQNVFTGGVYVDKVSH